MAANWFIGLPVAAGPWLSRLEPPAGLCVRLFAPSDLHLTVAFLGAVSREAAHAAFAQVGSFALAPCEVRLGPLVPLGRPARASAFSALLSEGREVVEQAISDARAAMFAAAGARPDTRPALAHLTLARPQRRASDLEVRAATEWARGVDLGAPMVRLDRIALYTWGADRARQLFRIELAQALPSGAVSLPARESDVR